MDETDYELPNAKRINCEMQDFTVTQLLEMLNPEHPKQISEPKKQQLQASLKRFQQVIPLIVNKRTNHVISGHQTVLAAAENGFRTLSALVADIDQQDETAYVIALRKVRGEWDEEQLAPLLLILNKEQQAVTGLSAREIAQIVGSIDTPVSEVESAAMNSAKAVAKSLAESIVTIKFGDLTVRTTQGEYEQWIKGLTGNGVHTAQSIGREIAKRIGVKHLVADH
jgi:ParB-like chromosome segregation protein Spo0J